MPTIQDLVITFGIGAIMALFILNTLGSYSPTVENAMQPHMETLNAMSNQTQQLINNTQTSITTIQYGNDPTNALAMALGGVATFTISFAVMLISVFLSAVFFLPAILINILFTVAYQILGIGNTPLAIAFTTFQNVLIFITTVVIVFGIAFKILMTRDSELT